MRCRERSAPSGPAQTPYHSEAACSVIVLFLSGRSTQTCVHLERFRRMLSPEWTVARALREWGMLIHSAEMWKCETRVLKTYVPMTSSCHNLPGCLVFMAYGSPWHKASAGGKEKAM